MSDRILATVVSIIILEFFIVAFRVVDGSGLTSVVAPLMPSHSADGTLEMGRGAGVCLTTIY